MVPSISRFGRSHFHENPLHGASGRPKNPGSLTRMIVAMVCLVGSGQLSCGFRCVAIAFLAFVQFVGL